MSSQLNKSGFDVPVPVVQKIVHNDGGFEDDCEVYSGVHSLAQWLDKGTRFEQRHRPGAWTAATGTIFTRGSTMTDSFVFEAARSRSRRSRRRRDTGRTAEAGADDLRSGVRGAGGSADEKHNGLPSSAQLLLCLCLMHLLAGLCCLSVILCHRMFAVKVLKVTDTELALVTSAASALLSPLLCAAAAMLYSMCQYCSTAAK